MAANYAERRRLVMSAQEKVASALADGKVSVVFDGTGPCVDLDKMVVHLPHVPEELTEEQMSLIRMYVDHEIGHVNYSDGTVIKGLDKVVFMIANAIEDGRINILQGNAHYGCKLNLEEGRDICTKDYIAKCAEFDAMGDAGSLTRAVAVLYLLSEGLSQDEAIKKIGAAHDPLVKELLDDVSHVIAKFGTFSDTKAGTSEVIECATEIKALWEKHIAKPSPSPGKGDQDEDEKEEEDGEDESSSKKSSGGEEDEGEEEEDEEEEGEEGDEDWDDGDETEEEDEESAGAEEEEDEGDAEDEDGESAGTSLDDEDEEEDEEEEADEGDPGAAGKSDEDEDEESADADVGGSDEDTDEDAEEDEDGADAGIACDEDEDADWDDMILTSDDRYGEAEEVEDNEKEQTRLDSKKTLSTVVETEDATAVDTSESSIEKAAEALREAAKHAAENSYGAVTGANVKIKVAASKTGPIARRYVAWCEKDQIVDMSHMFHNETGALHSEAREAVSFLKTRMQQDLMGRGKMWVRHQETGMLDDRKLASTRLGETRVFKRRLKRQKVNAAMTFLCDCSSSMNGPKIRLAMQLAMAFSEACELNDVPNEVLGFTSSADPIGGYGSGYSGDRYTIGGKSMKAFARWEPLIHRIIKPFNRTFRQRQHSFIRSIKSGGGCNVDGESIMWAARRLAERREENLWLIVLSDGQPNAYFCDNTALKKHCEHAIRQVMDAGIGVVGIGVGNDGGHVRQYYPDWIWVKDIDELLTGGYAKLSELLRRSRVAAI